MAKSSRHVVGPPDGRSQYLIAEQWRAKTNSKLCYMDALEACSGKVAALMDGDDARQHTQGSCN